MKKLLYLTCLLFVFCSFNSLKVAFAEDYQDPKYIEGNDILTEVEKNIDDIFGSMEEFRKIGNLYFDDDYKLHIKYKKTLLNSNKQLTQLLKTIDSSKVIIETTTYSPEDVTNIITEIQNDIKKYAEKKNYRINGHIENTVESQEINVDIKYDEINQNIILEHVDMEKQLLNKLSNKYSKVLIVKEVPKIETFEFTKSKTSEWNKLGAGLGIINPNYDFCSTAGIAYKNSNYFLLTAGHCFYGSVSSTGGEVISQFTESVGRQHSQALYAQLDVGLIRLTSDNTLSGGRYVTNGVKVAETSGTTEDFDNTIYSTGSLAIGSIVCKTGISTHKSCGTVSTAPRVVTIDGYNLLVAEIEGMASIGGDSGGAVYRSNSSGNLLLGILSAGNGQILNPKSQAVPISNIINHYGISIYTSSSSVKVAN